MKVSDPISWQESACTATFNDTNVNGTQLDQTLPTTSELVWTADWDWTPPLRATHASLKIGNKVQRWFTAALISAMNPEDVMQGTEESWIGTEERES